MFAEEELYDKESRYFGVELFDLDWDTFNHGNGLTKSQAEKKKAYYKKKGYLCRAVQDKAKTGRYVMYIRDKNVSKELQALLHK